MRFYKCIVVSLLLAMMMPMAVSGQTLTAEQEQQFKYYFYQAREDFANRRYAEALPQLLFCETLNPNDGQTKEYIGLIYLLIRQTGKATEYLKAANDIAPKTLWYNYLQLIPQENKKDRIAVLDQAANGNPKDEDIWSLYVEELVNQEEFSKALKAQDKLDKIKGNDIYSVATRHYVYMRLRQYKKALKVVNDYLELEPRDTRVRKLQIQTLTISQAKWKVLEKAYIDYMQYDQYDLTILNDYAYSMAINGGDLQKAESMSATTIREQPNNPTFLDTYAWILHLKGQDSLALFYMNKAIDNIDSQDVQNAKVLNYHRDKITQSLQKNK